MPRTSRTSFNSSQLVRLLDALRVADVAESQQTLADRLSHWIAWTDAVSLSKALTVGLAVPTSRQSAGDQGSAAEDAARRLRAELASEISADPVLRGGSNRRAQRPSSVQTEPAAAGPVQLRGRYLAHQQAMQTRIAPLRQRLRTTLSTRSAGLARLAALDAALEQALTGRERQLLANVPLLLERRAAHMAAEPRSAANNPLSCDDHSDAEPEHSGRTMQQLLLAELEVRMSPIDGMLAALADQTTTP